MHFDKLGTYDVTLTTTRADGASSDTTKSAAVRDLLIVSMGDSTGSGEGNPDVARHSIVPSVNDTVWENAQCHRSGHAAAAIAARRIEQADPHNSVTFVHLACSGASISIGLVNPYAGLDPSKGGMLDPQVSQLKQMVGSRTIDALILQIGANDISFGDIVTLCVFNADCPNMLVTRSACPCEFSVPPYSSDEKLYLNAAFDQGLFFWSTPTAAIHVTPRGTESLDNFVRDNVALLSRHFKLLATKLQEHFPTSLASTNVFVTEYFD